ncbi:MAG: transglutaminase domain-containing protein [Bacteroidota bacterium]
MNRKAFPVLLLLITWSISVLGQNPFSQLDEAARKTKGRDLKSIHSALDALSPSDSGKARAFFTWIAHNINYDVEEYKMPSPDPDKQNAEIVFRNKKGVCQGYANLFETFCRMSSLPCVVVAGHVRELGRYSPASHAWNAIRIGNDWKLVDATWGAGVLNENGKYEAAFDDKYFLSSGENFIEEHYPFDPVWQLLTNPVNITDYRKTTWSYKPTTGAKPYVFQDTISQWLSKDSVELLVNASKRILNFNQEIVDAREEACYLLINASNICFNRAFVLHEKLALEDLAKSHDKTIELKNWYKKAENCLDLIGTPPANMKSIVNEMRKTIRFNLANIDDN